MAMENCLRPLMKPTSPYPARQVSLFDFRPDPSQYMIIREWSSLEAISSLFSVLIRSSLASSSDTTSAEMWRLGKSYLDGAEGWQSVAKGKVSLMSLGVREAMCWMGVRFRGMVLVRDGGGLNGGGSGGEDRPFCHWRGSRQITGEASGSLARRRAYLSENFCRVTWMGGT